MPVAKKKTAKKEVKKAAKTSKKSEPKINIYSTPTCPYCKQAKEFLKKNNISFKDINVAEDQKKAREMVEKSGQFGVPVIEIGKKIIVGFQKDELKEALKIKG